MSVVGTLPLAKSGTRTLSMTDIHIGNDSPPYRPPNEPINDQGTMTRRVASRVDRPAAP